MAKFLVHIHTGPENPTKAALGFLVAATAAKEGHELSLFLAGDGVLLLDEVALSGLEGKGTGNLRNHFDAICAAGGRFYVSGMSAKARGMDEASLKDKPAEFAMPDVLVRLAAEADVVLTYWRHRIGGGAGEPIARYILERDRRVCGVDFAAPMLAIARSRFPEARWIEADMRHLDLGESFAGVIASPPGRAAFDDPAAGAARGTWRSPASHRRTVQPARRSGAWAATPSTTPASISMSMRSACGKPA